MYVITNNYFSMFCFLGMAASQPNKATTKREEDKVEEGERPGWWEEAAKKVREDEAKEKGRKEREDFDAWMIGNEKALFEETRRKREFEKKIKDAELERRKKALINWERNMKLNNERLEREHREFNEKVLREARRRRERQEEEEESERKRKGKNPSSTQ